MYDVGIVGGGISGLHLGIKLLDNGIGATIYHPQTADEIAQGRILNSVIHQYDTVQREQAMGINFWDEHNVRVGRGHDHCVNIPGQEPLRFWGSFKGYGKGVDYRLLIPRLMSEFERRGGSLVLAAKTRDDLPELQRQHDLAAIGVGRTASGFSGLFDQVSELSRHQQPARILCCGFFRGVASIDPCGVTLSLSPVSGELIVLPMETFDGPTHALLFENIPGGPAAMLADIDHQADPAAFHASILDIVRQFHPHTYERIDQSEFALHDDMALVQGAVQPVVRRAFAVPDGSAPVMAIGDLRVTMDPVTGAGAHLGSYGAWTLAEHITQHDGPFDVGFAERYEDAVRRRTVASVGFNDLVLAPEDYFVGLLMEMSMNRALCDEFTDGFADPERLWFDMVQDPTTAEAFASGFRS
jgi:2-polyprenyl-6-methoxyphenol hydroxylase-like FAD-dependent oxidoreductase